MTDVSIVLISDDPLLDAATRRLLASCRHNRLIGHLAYSDDTLRAAARLRPDVVLLAGTNPSRVASATAFLRRLCPHIRLLSQFGSEDTDGETVFVDVPHAPAPMSSAAPDETHAARLTPREKQVLGYAADALTNQQIAHQLGVSVGTVKRHLHSVFRKLGAVSRLDAVVRGSGAGVLGGAGAAMRPHGVTRRAISGHPASPATAFPVPRRYLGECGAAC